MYSKTNQLRQFARNRKNNSVWSFNIAARILLSFGLVTNMKTQCKTYITGLIVHWTRKSTIIEEQRDSIDIIRSMNTISAISFGITRKFALASRLHMTTKLHILALALDGNVSLRTTHDVTNFRVMCYLLILSVVHVHFLTDRYRPKKVKSSGLSGHLANAAAIDVYFS